MTQIVGQPCEFQVILGGPNRAGPGGPGWDREDPLSPTTHGARPRDRGPPRHCSWGLSNIDCCDWKVISDGKLDILGGANRACRHGVNMMPPTVRDAFSTNADGEPAVVTEEGRVWPRPTLVHTVPGDAVVVLNHTPHAPTYRSGAQGTGLAVDPSGLAPTLWDWPRGQSRARHR